MEPVKCPTGPEYKELEEALGKKDAYRAWIAFGETVPSLEKAREIIDLANRAEVGLQGKVLDAEIDTIVSSIGESITPEHPLNKVVDNYVEQLRSHLKKLSNNKNFVKLHELLTPEDRTKPELADTKALLQRAKESLEDLDGLKQKVSIVAGSILQSGKILDLMHESLDEILKTPDSAKENLPTVQSFLQLGRIFNKFLLDTEYPFSASPTFQEEISANLQKIRRLEDKVIESQKTALFQTLTPIISPALDARMKKVTSQIEALQKNYETATKLGKTDLAKSIKEDIARKEALLEYANFRQQHEAVAYMNGEKGDANISFLMESFRSSPDFLVSSFAQWLRQNFNDVDNALLPIEVEFSKAIAPHIETLGLTYRIDPEKLADSITYEEELLNSKGESYKELCYLGKFIGVELELIKLDQAVDKARAAFENEEDPDKKDDLEKALHRAEDALDKEKTDWWYREYTPEFHAEQAKLWRDDIGRDLKVITTKIWDEVRAIDHMETVMGYVTSEDLARKDALIRDYQMLANVNMPDGTKKTGYDLNVANRMQEIRAFNQEHYSWSTDQKLFDDKQKEYQKYLVEQKMLAPDSSEFATKVREWVDSNTILKITDEFYEDQTELYEAKAAIMEKSKDEEIQKDIADLNDEISGILKGNRDENNQPIGILIPEKAALRIKTTEEKLTELRKKEQQNSGLTSSQWAALMDLIRKKKEGILTLEDRADMDALFKLLKTKGLSGTDRKALAEINSKLDELRTHRPTTFYVDTHNEISGKYGVTINDLGKVVENGVTKDLFDSRTLIQLLENDDYETWFKLNHYRIDEFDPELNRSVKTWRRTRQWTKIVPEDPKYFEQVPSRRYSKRELKPEYQTGYNHSTGKVEMIVGTHVDNKGNFLPRELPSGKYRNETYYKMLGDTSPKGRAIAALHGIIYNDHLKNQEGAPNSNKLWNRVPRMHKRTRERIFDLRDVYRDNSRFTSQVKEDFKALVGTEKEYTFGTGNYEDELKAITEQEKALNKARGATGHIEDDLTPVRFKGKMGIEDLSRNIPAAHLKYAHAIKLAAKLNEMTPTQQSLVNILQASDKPTKRILGVVSTTKHKFRLQAINRLVERHFLGKSKAYELGKPVDIGAGMLKNITGFALLATRIPTTIGNVAKWSMENFIDAGNGAYTEKNWLRGVQAYSGWQAALAGQYLQNKIDHIPWQAQLDAIMKPKQRVPYEAVIGERPLITKTLDAFSLNWIRHHREWADYFTQKCLQLALMDATKIEHKLSDGSTKIIPYNEAWELDTKGHLKLKDGIDKSWAVGGANYNKFLLLQDTINGRINGFLDSIDQSFLQQYTSYTVFMFLKGWLVGSWLNHWSSSEIRVNKLRLGITAIPATVAGIAYAHYINPIMGPEIAMFLTIFGSGAFRSMGRFNLGTGQWWGRYPALLDMMAQKYDFGIKAFIPESMGGTKVEFSEYQRGISREAMKALGGIFFLTVLASAILGAGTAFGGFGRKFDEGTKDEKEAKDKLKNLAYWQKLALFEFLRLQVQTSTFSSADQHLAFLKGGPVLWGTVTDLWELAIYSMSDVTDKHRQPIGPPEEVPKWKKPFESVTGITGIKESLGLISEPIRSLTDLSIQEGSVSSEALDKAILNYERMRVQK